MLRNLILHITYLISRLHSSINKRIASLFEMISAIRGARQQHPLSMNAGSTLLQRRTVEMLVRRCTEPNMTGSSKASQFWDADAPFASQLATQMQMERLHPKIEMLLTIHSCRVPCIYAQASQLCGAAAVCCQRS